MSMLPKFGAVDFFLLYVTNPAFSCDISWLDAVFHYPFFL
jgi:hypothetical protein